MEKNPIITVFGSSSIPSGDPRHARAILAGRRLAEAGFTICCGGYQGLMAAACRGARRAGGQTIGITLSRFDPIPANEWIEKEIKEDSYISRLQRMIEMGQGYLVLDGGMGTLAELSLTWSLLQIGTLRERPCVLLGGGWRAMLDAFHRNLVIHEHDYRLLQLAAEPNEAVAIFRKAMRADQGAE